MKVVLDMDTGVDDAIALVLAVNSPELEILAITTVAGNAPVDLCTRNSLLLLELMESEAPVSRGADAPLRQKLLTAPEVHGPDGLGGEIGSLPQPHGSATGEPAHELLARLAEENPGEITLVATGPLTNVARALEINASGVAGYRRVISMAGAFDVPGNTGPVAEFNAYVDPEAASTVFSSGLDLTVVPLDATTKSPLSRENLERHPGAGGQAMPLPGRNLPAILYRALDYYIEFQRGESGLDAGFMHDPLAVASVFMPEILTAMNRSVEVVTEGNDRGRTIAGPAGDRPGVRVATDFDYETLHGLLNDRVLVPVFRGRPGPDVGPGRQ